MSEGDPPALLFGCKHTMHSSCGIEWIEKAGRVCPVCREGELEAQLEIEQRRASEAEFDRYQHQLQEEEVARQIQEEELLYQQHYGQREGSASPPLPGTWQHALQVESAEPNHQRWCCFGLCGSICDWLGYTTRGMPNARRLRI